MAKKTRGYEFEFDVCAFVCKVERVKFSNRTGTVLNVHEKYITKCKSAKGNVPI